RNATVRGNRSRWLSRGMVAAAWRGRLRALSAFTRVFDAPTARIRVGKLNQRERRIRLAVEASPIRAAATSATISKGGFDDSAGGLDEPAFAVDGLAVEPRDEPISDQRRREGAEIRRRHVAHRVSAVGINDQLARARHGANHSLGVLERA